MENNLFERWLLFVQAAVILSVLWAMVFVLRHSRWYPSKLTFLLLALFTVIAVLTSNPLRVNSFPDFTLGEGSFIVLLTACAFLLCSNLAVFQQTRRLRVFAAPVALLFLGIFLTVVIDPVLPLPDLLVTLMAIGLVVWSFIIIYRYYLDSHLPRTRRGRQGMLVVLVILGLWVFHAGFFREAGFLGAMHLQLLDSIAYLALGFCVLTYAYYAIRLSSLVPGRHLRRDAIYSGVVGLGTAMLVLFVFIWQVPAQGEVSLVPIFVVAAFIIIVQPRSFWFRRALANSFTRDIGDRVSAALSAATKLMAAEDLHTIISHHLDELRFSLRAERAELRLLGPLIPEEYRIVEVSRPHTIADLPSISLPIHQSNQSKEREYGELKIWFRPSASLPDISHGQNYQLVTSFTQSLEDSLSWFSFQESHWSGELIEQLENHKSMALRPMVDKVITTSLESGYSIDGISAEHRFYQDVRSWVADCQNSKYPSAGVGNSPLENLTVIGASRKDPEDSRGLRQFVMEEIVESEPPNGVRPRGEVDADDQRWQLYGILKLAIGDGCRDPDVCRQIGFEYPVDMDGFSPDLQGAESINPKLLLGRAPQRNSHSTYNRRKRDAISRLVKLLAALEQDRTSLQG